MFTSPTDLRTAITDHTRVVDRFIGHDGKRQVDVRRSRQGLMDLYSGLNRSDRMGEYPAYSQALDSTDRALEV